MNGYNPWAELDRMRSDMDRMFSRFAGTTPWRLAFLPGLGGGRGYPRLNIAETENGYKVDALAPGVNPDTFDVSVRNNTLTITGEKEAPDGGNVQAYHRSERYVGKFTRELQLPRHVDPEKVKASYKEGILTISLEKSEAARPRQIPVEVG